VKLINQQTFIEQFLEKIVSTVTTLITDLAMIIQTVFVTETVTDAVVKVEPGLGSTVGSVFTAPSPVGFMTTGNIYDDSGMGFIYAHRSPPKLLFPKTDSTRVLATGQPTWLDYANLVTVGGRLANPTTKYYEDNALAPLKWGGNSTHAIIVKGSDVKLSVPFSSLGSANDYFVMLIITDGTHKVVILWGITQCGTYASGVYFDGVFPALSTLTDGWYIIRFQDLNCNGIPDYTGFNTGEFTIVASGT